MLFRIIGSGCRQRSLNMGERRIKFCRQGIAITPLTVISRIIILALWIATLNHEILDYAVEGGGIIQTITSKAQKISPMPGSFMKECDGNITESCADYHKGILVILP